MAGSPWAHSVIDSGTASGQRNGRDDEGEGIPNYLRIQQPNPPGQASRGSRAPVTVPIPSNNLTLRPSSSASPCRAERPRPNRPVDIRVRARMRQRGPRAGIAKRCIFRVRVRARQARAADIADLCVELGRPASACWGRSPINTVPVVGRARNAGSTLIRSPTSASASRRDSDRYKRSTSRRRTSSLSSGASLSTKTRSFLSGRSHSSKPYRRAVASIRSQIAPRSSQR